VQEQEAAMDVFVLLHALGKLEGGLADLYAAYAAKFQAEPMVFALFRTLSQEEADHRNLVQYQVRLARESGEVFPEVPVDADGLQAAHARIARLQAGVDGVRLDEAVKSALVCEQDVSEQYYRTAMPKACPSLGKLLVALSSGEKTHVERLRGFAASRGWASGC